MGGGTVVIGTDRGAVVTGTGIRAGGGTVVIGTDGGTVVTGPGIGAGGGIAVVGTGARADDGAGGLPDVAGVTRGVGECDAAATDPPTTAAATTKMVAKRTRFLMTLFLLIVYPAVKDEV